MLPTHQLQVLTVVFFTVLAVGHTSAQGEEIDQNGDVVVSVTIKKVKHDIDNLRVKLKEAKKKANEAAQSLQSANEESRPRLAQTFKTADNNQTLLRETIAQTEQLVALAEAPGHEAERQQLLQRAEALTSVAHLTINSMQLHTDFLDELKQAAETSQAAASKPMDAASTGVDVFSGRRKGGGVFLDRVAEMPIAANTINRAEYDLGLGRFVLYQSGRRLLLPQTDPDLTATVVSCLYEPEPRNKVAVSMGIDPVSRGLLRSSALYHDEVLFGCERLWNTEAGRILIDSDDLLNSIWMGKNRLGEVLTRIYHYHSLAQIMLDHPMMPEMAHEGSLVINKKINMRVWIRPERITTRLIGNELVFDDVTFHMYTETLTKSNPRIFKGDAYPNPGADVFAAFFNQNFSRFAHMTVRDDDHTGRKIRPFEELSEVAKIAGVASWIKDSGIRMDASWATGYPVAGTLTRSNLPIITVHDVEKEITPPIVIYNQYGPSRIIDENGRMFMYKYDDTGRFVKMIRITKTDDGHIIEVPDTLVSGTTHGSKAQ